MIDNQSEKVKGANNELYEAIKELKAEIDELKQSK